MSRLFLLLAMLLVSGSIQTSPAVTMDKLHESWKLYMDECERNNTRAPPSAVLVCNRTFDKYACWPDGLPNTTVSVSCPWYLPWYHKVQHGLVYQECDANGQWLTMKNTSECDSNNPSQQYYGHIRIMYTVGYSLSLVALVLALSILIFFRKLHCMRNNIHMNLFASFILRALSILIKDALMEANITSQDLSRDQEQGLSRASVSPVDLLVNNEINFLIFIHIIKILVSKLRAHQMRYTDYKFRLAKSTLTLIPLLGIHQVVFIYVTDEATETTIGLRLTKLVIDLFFSSFQGLLVAILYCFVNKEVQSEVLKKWKRWKLGRHIEEEYRHTYSNTPNTKTASLLNHVSQRTPRLADAPAEPSTPVCGPEERHALVANGEAAGRQEGAIGDRPPAEDAGLPDGAESERAESRH
ncbi:glucagon receptor isoform X3 [Phyllopteryx taeniolatus]|uniref:glucagon receptor isoform X3 n=1 Tax=Phyllopteryx taeniolatus TaxID=161469 RepID=UPI002AD409AD|nr:glucagon receptor isoform X3 [Phyllopteryx taeniolatus]